ncbi:hypothetical protein HOY80DRAFT_879828, partial [Tuber brumale]
GAGPYSNLQTIDLWHQEATFEIIFGNNPLPFCTLAKFPHPGQFTPTVAHAFISITPIKNWLLAQTHSNALQEYYRRSPLLVHRAVVHRVQCRIPG